MMHNIQLIRKMESNNEEIDIQKIIVQWRQLRKQQKGLRIRDAARQLNVSEAELLVTGESGKVVRLIPNWGDLFAQLVALETVMLLTRDDVVVHEVTGKFRLKQSDEENLIITGDSFDVRLDLSKLCFAFAVEDNIRSGIRYSVQFFNAFGEAAFKLYLTEWSQHAVYSLLVSRFRKNEQYLPLLPERSTRKMPQTPRAVSAEIIQKQWLKSAGVAVFDAFLQDYGINWQQASDLLGHANCSKIHASLLHEVLKLIAQQSIPVIISVNNDHGSARQQFKGVIENIRITGEWLNVLDKNFNLHIKQAAFASAWILRKSQFDSFIPQLQFLNQQGGRSLVITCASCEFESAAAAVWQDIIAGLETSAHFSDIKSIIDTESGENNESL